MAIKLKSSGKSKTAVKSKSAVKKKLKVKPYKKTISKQSDLSRLPEDIISNVGVGLYIVQNSKFV
ncbi:MAG: hypothetical protein A2W27_08010 [Deltaproteobacteria bacterium RBG_16_44_11]|nr:MAG: hypothetical protein A2W27_08010 [Deltaproteobacteria bacterium RBG_16_44_11]